MTSQSPLLDGILSGFLRKPLPPPVTGMLGKVLHLNQLEQLCRHAQSMDAGRPFPQRVLDALDVRCRVSDSDLAKVPAHGPVVAVANHPFGMIEGALLAALLPRVRQDVRILANHLLGIIPDLHGHLILVDPFGGPEAARRNSAALREAIAWLACGGMLVAFPAGEVSYFDFRHRAVTDPAWKATAAWLIRQTNAASVPLFFAGTNGPLFQVAGLVHPALRTLMLPNELLNKRQGEIELRIGAPVPAQHWRGMDDQAITAALRQRTYRLSRPLLAKRRFQFRAPVAPPVDPKQLAQELSRLPENHRLLLSGPFEIWEARAEEIPALLREIARLREAAFRAAGEGTGRPLDIDRFDNHYRHLFLWNAEAKELVGAYRICPVDTFAPRLLYTQTLFDFDTRLESHLGASVELGRSFVREEYQKNYHPLLLLWKGIAAWLRHHPQYRRLFGPVSVSNAYHPLSRNLMVSFLDTHFRDPELGGLARPRNPWRQPPEQNVPSRLEDLSSLVADLEPDGKGVPVLLRHYLKLGARVVAFNVDPRFGNALDALIVLDLQSADPARLARLGIQAMSHGSNSKYCS